MSGPGGFADPLLDHLIPVREEKYVSNMIDLEWMRGSGTVAGAALLLLGLCSSRTVSAGPPLTLDEALREARRANAGLPVAAADTLVARAGLEEARGALGPSLRLDGDLHDGAPRKYASGDARLQLVAGLPIYDGGRLRAGVSGARAEVMLSTARYRMAAADLDLEVRTRFAGILGLEEERRLAEQGVARLERYVELIEARRRSGDPVAGDLLRARVRLDGETADLEDIAQRLEGRRLEMNDLLGRTPADSLALAPLPPPAPPPAPAAGSWESAPDLEEARLTHRRELARIDEVRAERRPHLDLEADVGTEPTLGAEAPANLNTGTGSGAEFVLNFSWPLLDFGAYRGRLRRAELSARQAGLSTEATRRAVRLDWTRARSDMEHLYRQVATWNHAVPAAEEAYLQAESSYRGGEGSVLDVLDAFDQWVQAGRSAAQAVYSYREAEARALRWGTP